MARTLSTPELEVLFAQLSTAIDRAGPDGEVRLLTRLVLLLAHELGDAPRTFELIARAEREPA